MTAFRLGAETIEDSHGHDGVDRLAGIIEGASVEPSTRERQTVDIPTAARMLGCSRGLAYKMAREGRLPVIQLSPRRVVVPLPALMKMLTGTEDGNDDTIEDRTGT